MAQKAKLNKEVQNEAAENHIDSARACGELLAGMKLHGGDRKSSRHDVDLKLGEEGMPTQKESERWQKVAEAWKLYPDKMQTKVDETRSDGYELTFTSILKYAENLLREGGNVEGAHEPGRQFSEEQILEAAFQHYRETGFPYPNLPLHICMEHINKLADTPMPELRGTNLGYRIADTYHPHRFDGHAIGMNSPRRAFEDDKLLRRALRLVMEDRGVLGYDLLRVLYIVAGTQANSNFRPGFASYMYRQYCQPGDTVLDTSTGYGGRLVGFMASGIAGKYIGIDPSVQTHESNTRMASELGFDVELYNIPAEDMDLAAVENRCDFAFTSPPYFRKEVYADEDTQSSSRYSTADDWLEGFLKPMMRLQYAALKVGAASALNIADVEIGGVRIPLVDMAKAAANEAGFTHAGDGEFRLQKRFGGGHENADVSSEAMLFFRRGVS